MTAILKCDCRTCATIGDDFAPLEWKDQHFDFCPECEERMQAAIDSVLSPPRLMSDPETDQLQSPANQLLSLEQIEQRHVLAVLTVLDWNKSAAARTLGIERSTLQRKLKKYQLRRPGPLQQSVLPFTD